MHLPIAHLSGFEEESEELQAQLQTNSGSHSQDEEGSQSQGSKGSGFSAPDGKPVKDLPCPRCQSMNTKFCYYNNYSVNQPRHFCRNCQRYWTVGGTLRNVPVGGGSRKKTRTRSRSDPYYRPGTSPAPGSELDSEHHHPGVHPMASALPDMQLHPDASSLAGFIDTFPELPFHPAQISSFLQFALQQNHGLFSQFLNHPSFPITPEDEAELQAFYETQTASSGFLNNAAALMSSGLFLPELEPAHLALMQKATLWAEAQRLQSLARRQTAAQAAAWAEERECKPSMSAQMQQQRQNGALEELRNRQHATSMHRRPGFWETALMHSRPSKRQGSSQAWEETKPLVHEEEGTTTTTTTTSSANAYPHAGYDDSPSWGSNGLHTTPEMYY